jgi:hypothetical protein
MAALEEAARVCMRREGLEKSIFFVIAPECLFVDEQGFMGGSSLCGSVSPTAFSRGSGVFSTRSECDGVSERFEQRAAD